MFEKFYFYFTLLHRDKSQVEEFVLDINCYVALNTYNA